MSRQRRFVRVAFGALGLVFVLLLAAAVIIARWATASHLRERAASQLSQQLTGPVQIDSLRVSIVPLPHLTLANVTLSIPGSVDATIATVSLYPRWWPLLRGALQLARVRVSGADIRVRTPPVDKGTPARGLDSLAELRDAAAAFAAVVSSAAARMPGLAADIERGALTLPTATGASLTFQDVHAHLRLSADETRLELSCTSPLWENVTVSAAFGSAGLDGSGRIELTRLRPQAVNTLLLTGSELQVHDSEVNLAVNFVTRGLTAVQADVAGSFPALSFSRGADRLDMHAGRLQGALQIDERTASLEIGDLRLGYPPAQLSGRMVQDRSPPRVRLELNAREVDVAAVRRVATFFGGEVAMVHRIFDTLQSGTVPQLSLQAEAQSVAECGAALVIRGRLVGGEVDVPGVHLHLRDVTGEATVADGVLVGEQISARFGGSQTSAGTVRVGLTRAAPVLQVDTAVTAEAADLPQLLKRLVDSDALSRELDRISQVDGTAAGKLILRGTTQNATATVDVADGKITASVHGLPHPLHIDGGHIVYDSRQITATDLQVGMGNSALSHFSLAVDWNGARPVLQASCGASRLTLQEIYPWLKASGWLPDSAWNPQALSGTVALDSLRLNGPASTPAGWRFDLAGAAQDLEVDLPMMHHYLVLRAPLALSAARVSRDPNTGIALSGQLAAPGGLTAAVEMTWGDDELNVKRLVLRDAHSDASFSLRQTHQELELAFAGNVNKSTVDALIPDNRLLGGWLQGNLRARIVTGAPTRSAVEGKLEGREIALLHTLTLERVTLDADAGILAVDSDIALGPDHRVHVHGTVRPAPGAFVVDLDAMAGHLDWDSLEPLLPQHANRRADIPAQAWDQPLRGSVRVSAESFTAGGFTWSPVRAIVELTADGTSLTISEANICGIATPGNIAIAPQGLDLSLNLAATHRQLDATAACLENVERGATGAYSLRGVLSAHGRRADLGQSLAGHVEFKATEGRIYRLGILANVLSVISVATGSVWNLPAVTADGLAFDSIALTGDLHHGTLALREAVLNGPSVRMVCEGSADMVHRTMDLTFLVAPLKTVDSVVNSIPVISGVFGGSLVSIPVKISGTFANPTVTPLSPATVGSGLMSVMRRTLKLPMRVVQPLFPGPSDASNR